MSFQDTWYGKHISPTYPYAADKHRGDGTFKAALLPIFEIEQVTCETVPNYAEVMYHDNGHCLTPHPECHLTTDSFPQDFSPSGMFSPSGVPSPAGVLSPSNYRYASLMSIPEVPLTGSVEGQDEPANEHQLMALVSPIATTSCFSSEQDIQPFVSDLQSDDLGFPILDMALFQRTMAAPPPAGDVSQLNEPITPVSQFEYPQGTMTLLPEEPVAADLRRKNIDKPHYGSRVAPKHNRPRGIVRHSELVKPFRNGGEQVAKYERVHLDFSPNVIHMLNEPWSASEVAQGRRIVRVGRVQEAGTMHVNFTVVDPDYALSSKYLSDAVEVSCLVFHLENAPPEYVITSVEVLKIVVMLTGGGNFDKVKQRFERARIRSNLMPFWNKYSYNNPSDDYEDRLHRDCIRRSITYRDRKPIDVIKDVRLMRWSVLPAALERAMLFYRYVE